MRDPRKDYDLTVAVVMVFIFGLIPLLVFLLGMYVEAA
jgi:hypothetical protein